MFIRQALSYGDAWSRLNQHHDQELEDIKHAASLLTPYRVSHAKPLRPHPASEGLNAQCKLYACWHDVMQRLEWLPPPLNVIWASGGRHLSLRLLGHVKNQVSLALIRNRDLLNRWLYTIAPMGARSGAVEIPTALLLLEDAEVALLQRSSLVNVFELLREELVALSPLSHNSPFLVLAASAQSGDFDVVELAREEGVNFRQIVVNRSIEFPAQYHQAGLGVLTYFGTVLREKYPNHDAKVRIEQEGLKVRMIIESENGDKEIIEKALQEYELVVRGEKPPENFFPNAASVIELKNELRIAQLRVESQRDIINLQGEQVTSLRQLFEHSLSRAPAPVTFNVQPVITVSSTVSQCTNFTTSIPDLSEDVRELLTLSVDEALCTRLLDLAEALDLAGEKATPAEVKCSSGLSKLKSFLQDASTVGTKANDALKKVEDGVGIVQSLGRKYNAVAEWCGAPQIPRVLLGKDA